MDEERKMPPLVTLPEGDDYDEVIIKKKKKKPAKKIYIVEATSSEGEEDTENYIPNREALEKQRILQAIERQRNNRR